MRRTRRSGRAACLSSTASIRCATRSPSRACTTPWRGSPSPPPPSLLEPLEVGLVGVAALGVGVHHPDGVGVVEHVARHRVGVGSDCLIGGGTAAPAGLRLGLRSAPRRGHLEPPWPGGRTTALTCPCLPPAGGLVTRP